MSRDKNAILAQIDAILLRYEEVRAKWWTRSESYGIVSYSLVAPGEVFAELISLMTAAIERFAPNGSKYADSVLTPRQSSEQKTHALLGALKALRDDYHADRLLTVQQLLRADIFSDFLEMAEYLMNEGYKDAPAVIAGGVLEQHLRKLCDKYSISTTHTDPTGKGKPKKLDAMNSELAKVGAYGSNDQKQITAWADIRNDAAHGHWEKYQNQHVSLMLHGIRQLLSRLPA